MVASHGTMGWSSTGAQKAKALEDANTYCKQQAKEVEPIADRETDRGFGKIALNFAASLPANKPAS
jgi:hypothetical protein